MTNVETLEPAASVPASASRNASTLGYADIRDAISCSDRAGRSRAITEVFLSTLCADLRRARLCAESPALPALEARRDGTIAADRRTLTAAIVAIGRALG